MLKNGAVWGQFFLKRFLRILEKAPDLIENIAPTRCFQRFSQMWYKTEPKLLRYSPKLLQTSTPIFSQGAPVLLKHSFSSVLQLLQNCLIFIQNDFKIAPELLHNCFKLAACFNLLQDCSKTAYDCGNAVKLV